MCSSDLCGSSSTQNRTLQFFPELIELLGKFFRIAIAHPGRGMGCPAHNGVELGAALGESGRWPPGVGGNLAREEFVEEDPDREDVGAFPDCCRMCDDRRRRIDRGATDGSVAVLPCSDAWSATAVAHVGLSAWAQACGPWLDVGVASGGWVGGSRWIKRCLALARWGVDLVCVW